MTETATLTPERRRTLHAVVERIMPGTDGPGAGDAAVAVAVERAILHRVMRGLRGGVEQVLDHLQAQAGAVYANEFSACAPHEQDELLLAVERDPNPWTQFLFRYLIVSSLEGLLGDPAHGGNLGFRGWDAIGLRADEVRSGLCRGARAAG
jgi:gluconate 2-dehydrogenase gamma chain